MGADNKVYGAHEMKTEAQWDFEKAMDSGRRLKEMGWNKQRILHIMEESGNFNMAVAVLALDELFGSEGLDSRAGCKAAA